MTCDFVGHPVVAEPLASDAERAAISGPGRSSLPLWLAQGRGDAAGPGLWSGRGTSEGPPPRPCAWRCPQCGAVAGLVRDLTSGWAVPPQIHPGPGGEARGFRRGGCGACRSGTVSLELAANACPMVIAYDMHPLTLWLMRRAA